ncbi:hypothetical protein ACIBUY_29400 [Streptomyces sp. NPDC050085]|uniref:hypothetical protein n=1 Tax=Streptomyces sp. NPDC050085 TaxID=3365600 RepID=UPI0037B3619C
MRAAVVAAGLAVVVGATGSAHGAPARGTTERISVAADGTQADGESTGASVSGDGRFVVFSSAAANLVPGDTNADTDVFLRDLRRGTVQRIGEGGHGASISANGRYVTYRGQTGSAEGHDFYSGYFLYDRRTGRTEVVSLSDDDRPVSGGYGTGAVMSSDGRYVVFDSPLSENGDSSERTSFGMYLRDREKGTTRLMSPTVFESGYWTLGAATISADGSRIAFSAGQVKPGFEGRVYVYDRRAGKAEVFAKNYAGQPYTQTSVPTFSADGRYAAFTSSAPDLVPDDTNGTYDAFVRDLRTGATRRVSVSANGGQSAGSWSGAQISGDGRYVAFSSSATDLVAGDTRHGPLFLRDLRTGVTERLSVGAGGAESDDQAMGIAALSRDASTAVFGSWATNLVPGDTNGVPDVFVRRVSRK